MLVVDDEPLVRWAVAEALGEHGYAVTEAGDAASAMRELAAPRNCTDVVLLDVCLPDCDDLHVLSLMRKLSPNTPVIVMTAHGTPEIVEEATRLGAMVVNKPFDMNELAPLVEHALAARAG